MLRRIARFLVFAIESALPMNARPPESVRRLPRRLGRVLAVFATLPLVMLVSTPASAGGFGAGAGAGLGGAGSLQELDLGGVAAVQQLRAEAARAATERDCETRYRSFRARNTLRPSERRRRLAACRDFVRASDGLMLADRGH